MPGRDGFWLAEQVRKDQTLQPATVKLSPSIRETVENYDELKRHFQGSRWGRFFVD